MRTRFRIIPGLLPLCLLGSLPGQLRAQSLVDENVVYGMYSGLALLMDVHYPGRPNGYRIVVILGSGWHAPLEFNAPALKEGVSRPTFQSEELLAAGYTLFAISHRAAPRFRYPMAVEYAQRAVRFIRYNADKYGIDANRIGAIRGSSGGHLVSMLGTLDGYGDNQAQDPVDRESSKVQAVVALFPPTDLVQFIAGDGGAKQLVASFIGSVESADYEEASPVTYVTAVDPPFLLIHGDADPVVPFTQSEIFRDRLAASGDTVKLIRIVGGGHGNGILQGSNASDYFGPLIDWFDSNLRE